MDAKLSELDGILEEWTYPLSKDDAIEAAEAEDVTLLYADGDEPLSDVLARVDDDEFDSVNDLETEIYNALPTEAVGEPGQSEGEG